MDDAFIEYIDRKISEATRKRDEIKLPPINDDDYMHRLRIWWCYESRRQAYEDALVQYKLKTILKKKPEKPSAGDNSNSCGSLKRSCLRTTDTSNLPAGKLSEED